jgi:hypothetical protein
MFLYRSSVGTLWTTDVHLLPNKLSYMNSMYLDVTQFSLVNDSGGIFLVF